MLRSGERSPKMVERESESYPMNAVTQACSIAS